MPCGLHGALLGLGDDMVVGASNTAQLSLLLTNFLFNSYGLLLCRIIWLGFDTSHPSHDVVS